MIIQKNEVFLILRVFELDDDINVNEICDFFMNAIKAVNVNVIVINVNVTVNANVIVI